MDSIIVTAQRRPSAGMLSAVAVVASQEDLGDLKLYRVPIPVTVAANGQNQVALLVKDGVPFRTVYRLRLYPGAAGKAVMPAPLLRMPTKKAEGPGVPLQTRTAAECE